MEWKLAEAKNKFSEVINKALLEGPQKVVRRDQSFIIIEENQYKKLTGKKSSFKDYILNAPSLDGLDLSRDQSPVRNTDL
ncbi:MAG: type II toxin-antitoxin system Phd/YefM family antitoxin [Nitrospinaceae bacterium]